MKQYQCIVTITMRGKGAVVVELSKREGAQGGTILHGKGSSIHETKKLFGGLLEPEREVVLTLVEKEKVDAVMKAIQEGMKLNQIGKGILFVLDVEDVAGLTKIDSDKG